MNVPTSVFRFLAACLLLTVTCNADDGPDEVDATTLHGKVLCGYQGWFRCPGDAADQGWAHWSRDSRKIAPETLTFEMWPDMADFGEQERFKAPGFTHPDGKPAYLFSSDNAATVLRHFQWMREYGIDGVWLQHFVVELPGAPGEGGYKSRRRVMSHLAEAARKTGRAWAITYDIAGCPADRIYDCITRDWKNLVDEGVAADPRYLQEADKPVVEIFGFYKGIGSLPMTTELGNRLIDFFKQPGPYQAYLAGGGAWNWREIDDPAWQKMLHRLDAYIPWNVGNHSIDADGTKRATMHHWADDKAAFEDEGGVWIPVIYPGFSWDNLKRRKPGASAIPRRGGEFYWEQFHQASKLKPACIFVAMFDEVDEGTAIFKVTSDPPVEAHFVGYEGLPSDWYLRLTGLAAKEIRGGGIVPEEMPGSPP